MKRIIILAAASSIALTACMKTTNPPRPVVTAPQSWAATASTPTALNTTPITAQWWETFGSTELNAVVTTALSKNNDLNAALHRIEQARASLRIAGADLKPTVGGNANASVNRDDPSQGSASTRKSISTGLDVSYELDLFGANQAAVDAATATLDASMYDRDALALVTMADTAKTYFTLVNARERMSLARNDLDNRREILRIVKARFEAGSGTALDVAQQESSVTASEASLKSLQAAEANANTALALLLGQTVQETTVTAQQLATLNTPHVDAGQPSSLLERRPDIKSAEAGLIGAGANITAARAAFYPSVNLGSGFDITKSPLGDPLATALSIAASLSVPIFEGGRLEGGVERATAQQAELAENYRKTVLTAFKEVEDALTAFNTAEARSALLVTSMQQAQIAYDLTRKKFDAGAIDLQSVIETQNTLLSAQDGHAQARMTMLSAAVDLYKALGGGWQAK